MSSITSIRWVILDTFVSKGVVLLTLILIARKLGPELVGVIAAMALVRELATVISDFGLSQAIINFKNPNNRQLATLYSVNWFLGCGAFIIVFSMSTPIALLFSEPQLSYLLPYVAINFLLAPIGQQVNALLRKSMSFQVLTKISILSTLLGATISIFGVYMGFGIWAVVVSGLLTNAVMQISYLIVARQRQLLHGFSLDFKESKALLSYGIYRVGASGLNFFNFRMDQIIIGSMFGSAALGLYLMATSWTLNIMQQINGVAAKVAFPAISKFQDDIPRVKSAYLRLVNRACTINIAVFFGLIVIAEPLVTLLLGTDWLQLIILIKLMSAYVLFRSLGNLNGLLAMGLGKANWAFYWNLTLFSIIPIVLFLASKFGSLETVVISLICLHFIFSVFMYFFWTRKLIGSCLKEYIIAVGAPSSSGIIMVIAIYSVQYLLGSLDEFSEICVSLFVGGIVYIMTNFLFNRAAVLEILDIFFKRRQASDISK